MFRCKPRRVCSLTFFDLLATRVFLMWREVPLPWVRRGEGFRLIAIADAIETTGHLFGGWGSQRVVKHQGSSRELTCRIGGSDCRRVIA